MIIVSQDKDVIINFDNVESIEIGNINENQNKGVIYVRLKSDYFYKIGEYATEERTKEVLQEIITRHGNWENMKMGQPSGLCLPVYEMPEE